MKEINTSLKINMSPSDAGYYFLTIMVFFRTISYAITNFADGNKILSSLFYVPVIINYLCVFIFVIPTLIFAIVKIQRGRSDCILFIFFVLTGIFGTKLLFPNNMQYVTSNLWSYIYILTSFCMVRLGVVNIEKIERWYLSASRFLFWIFPIIIIKSGFNIGNDYMNYSDAATIVCGMLLYGGFIKGFLADKIKGSLLAISLVIWGSRGAMLSLVLLILLFTLFMKNYNKKIMVIISVLLAVVFVLIVGQDFIGVLLNKLGVNSRTIESLLNGDLFVSNQRMKIYTHLIKLLKENWLFGIGLFGDRLALPLAFPGTKHIYTHNVLLEILVDFGVVLGGILCVIIINILFKKFFFNSKLKNKEFISVLFVCFFVQLLISRTYITEVPFFILLALILKENDKLKQCIDNKGM